MGSRLCEGLEGRAKEGRVQQRLRSVCWERLPHHLISTSRQIHRHHWQKPCRQDPEWQKNTSVVLPSTDKNRQIQKQQPVIRYPQLRKIEPHASLEHQLLLVVDVQVWRNLLQKHLEWQAGHCRKWKGCRSQPSVGSKQVQRQPSSTKMESCLHRQHGRWSIW